MNVLHTLLSRKKLSTVLFMLVLLCSIIMGTVGSASMVSARIQKKNIEESYTTIAYYGGDECGVYGGLMIPEEDGRRVLDKVSEISQNVVMEDIRCGFLAHTLGNTSLSPFEYGDYDNDMKKSVNNTLMVIAGTCEQVTRGLADGKYYESENDDENEIPYFTICDDVEFNIDKIICHSDAFDLFEDAEKVGLWGSSVCKEDGSPLFEEGKSYVIFAMSVDNGGIKKCRDGYEIPDPFHFVINTAIHDAPYMLEERVNDEEIHYQVLVEESLPLCAEYEGDIDEFLESEEGRVWREQVIPYCQMNYQSASVIGTNNLDSMVLFNKGIASISEGGKIQANEYEEGHKVCLVSASYAAKNKLAVGDKVVMDLYSGSFGDENWIQDPDSDAIVNRWQPFLQSKDRIGFEGEWEIVGIYSGPDFLEGRNSFNANTIIVPKKSVPSEKGYEQIFDPLYYSIVLKNGTEKKFAKAIEPYIVGEPFLYENQDYSASKEAIKTMMKNVKRLFLACSIGAVISLAIVIFLYWKRVFGTTVKMRLLGVSKKRVFGQAILSMLPVIGIVGVIGMGLGMILCKVALKTLAKVEIPVQFPTIMISVVVEVAFVLIIISITMTLMLMNRLINKKME